MRMRVKAALLSALLSFPVLNAPAINYSVVHSLGVTTNVSGFEPQSQMVEDASGVLYGTTSVSEGDLTGTVFKVNRDGSGFQVLMNFTAPVDFTNSNGANPYGGLALSGSTLYGTTYNGGSGGSGTVFAINTDGTGFKVLTNFPSARPYLTNSIGAHPYGGLTVSGSTLYGTTQGGGTTGSGTVFSMDTSGAGLTVLKTFSAMTDGINSDGAQPDGAVVLANGVLYGTTVNGGSAGQGTVFALNPTTLNFNVLHPFTGGNDGANPHAGLVLSGGWLYGTASGGGSDGSGTVFTVNTSGGGFNYIYTFTGGDDGANPDGGVILANGTLYGATYDGGTSGFGTVYSITTNVSGGTFSTLYEFTGDSDGGNPLAGLVLSGGTLYGSTAGVTAQEDTAGGNGTLFSVTTNGADFTNIYTFNYSDAAQPTGGLIACGNVLYGTTYNGGSGGNGTVFQVNRDGTGYAVIKNFSAFSYDPFTFGSANDDGANPQAGLVMSGGTLYGTTYYGGSSGVGGIFGVNTNGAFTNLYSFTGGNDGADPQGGLVLAGNTLYGTTTGGGSEFNGVVFAINTDGTGFRLLKTFSATTSGTNGDGANPSASLILSGTTLYGTATYGGVNGFGTVFSVDTGTGNFVTLHSFANGSDGANPYGTLVLAGNWLYGTAFSGGSATNGTVFMLPANGSSFVPIHNFSAVAQNTATGLSTNSDGANPSGGLALCGSMLYGTTSTGGINGYGTAFAFNTNGSGATFSNIYTFVFTNGANPAAGMLLCGNSLYGTTPYGGDTGDGTVFDLTLFQAPVPLNIQLAGDTVILTWTNSAFALQAAPVVNGIYTNLPGAASPFTNSLNATQQFFQLKASQ